MACLKYTGTVPVPATVYNFLDILTSGLPNLFKKVRWDNISGRASGFKLGDNFAKGKERHWLKLV